MAVLYRKVGYIGLRYNGNQQYFHFIKNVKYTFAYQVPGIWNNMPSFLKEATPIIQMAWTKMPMWLLCFTSNYTIS